MGNGKKVVLVAALGTNREIGAEGTMPWRLKSDMKRFRQLTTGHSVIMGRVTFVSILEALRKPLPKRQNIVVTRGDFSYPGVTVAHSIEEAVQLAEMPGEVICAGGGQIYELAMPLADEMWLTHVHGFFPEADTLFPVWTGYHWLVQETPCERGENDSHDTTFRLWQKVLCDF